MNDMNAYIDLMTFLGLGELVEGIVFGAFGWACAPESGEEWEPDQYGSEEPPFVPYELRGKLLSLEEARSYMEGWSFYGSFGSPDCYATYVWTNERVIWVTQYDGATSLTSMPRNPTDCIPDMPGG